MDSPAPGRPRSESRTSGHGQMRPRSDSKNTNQSSGNSPQNQSRPQRGRGNSQNAQRSESRNSAHSTTGNNSRPRSNSNNRDKNSPPVRKRRDRADSTNSRASSDAGGGRSGPEEIIPETHHKCGVAIRAVFFPKAHRAELRRRGEGVAADAKKLPDWFEALSLVIIFLNMVSLALNDPTDSQNASNLNKVLSIIETVFTFFFTFELLMRFLAWPPKQFISDRWNLLDLLVVVTGLVSFTLDLLDIGFASFTVIRTLRVIRPLKSAQKFPSVRIVMGAMLSSVRALVDVSVLFLLFVLSFSSAGVSQFSGALRSRCVNDDVYLYYSNRTRGYEAGVSRGSIYNSYQENLHNWTRDTNLTALNYSMYEQLALRDIQGASTFDNTTLDALRRQMEPPSLADIPEFLEIREKWLAMTGEEIFFDTVLTQIEQVRLDQNQKSVLGNDVFNEDDRIETVSDAGGGGNGASTGSGGNTQQQQLFFTESSFFNSSLPVELVRALIDFNPSINSSVTWICPPSTNGSESQVVGPSPPTTPANFFSLSSSSSSSSSGTAQAATSTSAAGFGLSSSSGESSSSSSCSHPSSLVPQLVYYPQLMPEILAMRAVIFKSRGGISARGGESPERSSRSDPAVLLRNETFDLFYEHVLEFGRTSLTLTPFVCGGTYEEEVLGMGGEDESAFRGCGPTQMCEVSTDSIFLHGYFCPFGYSCVEVGNPVNGIVGFDNLFQAALTIQTLVTLEFIPEVTYYLMDSVDFTGAVFVVIVVVLGCFFIINLLVAMIAVEFERSRGSLTEEYERYRKKARRKNILERMASAMSKRKATHARSIGITQRRRQAAVLLEEQKKKQTEVEGFVVVDELESTTTAAGEKDQEMRELPHRTKKSTSNNVTNDRQDEGVQGDGDPLGLGIRKSGRKSNNDGSNAIENNSDSESSSSSRGIGGTRQSFVHNGTFSILSEEDVLALRGQNSEKSNSLNQKRSVSFFNKKKSRPGDDFDDDKEEGTSRGLLGENGEPRESGGRNIFEEDDDDEERGGQEEVLGEVLQRGKSLVSALSQTMDRTRSLALRQLEEDEAADDSSVLISGINKFRFHVRTKIVETPVFQNVTMAIIVLSVLVMAGEFYGMSKTQEQIFEYINLGFTIFVSIEMIVRFLAATPLLFVTDFGNIILIIVVTISWADYFSDAFRLPAIKTLRVFIAYRLIQRFPNIDKWFKIIFKAFKSSVVLLFIIGLNLFIFACLGMEIFGGKFCGLEPDSGVDGWCQGRPQANFDSFGDAFLSAFKLLAGDNWNEIMYSGMRAVNPWVCLLFIANHFVAVYVLVNLFVGIMLSATEEVQDEEDNAQDGGAEGGEGGGGSGDQDDDDNDDALIEFEEEAHRNSAAPTGFIPKMRWNLRNAITTKGWDLFMILVILASMVSLGISSPIAAPDTSLERFLFFFDVVCTGIFIFEFLLQIFVHGFVMEKTSYLRRSHWNKLDALLVLLGIADIILSSIGVSDAVAVAKGLYCLRPLRLMRRSAGIQLVLQALLKAVPAIKDVTFVIFMFWTVFAISGIQIFKGQFYSCSDDSYTNQTSCEQEGYTWVNAPYHFDHFPMALVTLFVLSTFEGWAAILHQGIDAVGPGQAGRTNHSPVNALFFIGFCLFAGFFLINLFISVLIGTYEKEKKRMKRKHMFLTPAQAAWVDSHHELLNLLPVGPYLIHPVPHMRSLSQKIRAPLIAIVTHPGFEWAIHALVILNFICMAMDHYPAPKAFTTTLATINLIFVVVFTVEAVLKLSALGPKFYFAHSWNRFDFAVVIVSILGALAETYLGKKSFGSVFRTMRVLRLLRVVKGAKRVHVMVKKFSLALYSLNNVAALVMLFFTIFALILMRVFGKIAWDGSVINYNANFTTFFRALLTLFRMSTGGAWPDIMHALRKEAPDCDPDLGDCGFPILAPIVVILFIIGSTYVLLNVFVAVIMDSFSSSESEEDEDNAVLDELNAKEFVDLWTKFDNKRTLHVSSLEVIQLLRMLPPDHPFAIKVKIEKYRGIEEVRYFIKLGLKDCDGKVEFLSLICALFRKSFKASLDVNETVLKSLQKEYNAAFRDRVQAARVTLAPRIRHLAEYAAGLVILRNYRARRQKLRERIKLVKETQRTYGVDKKTAIEILEEEEQRERDTLLGQMRKKDSPLNSEDSPTNSAAALSPTASDPSGSRKAEKEEVEAVVQIKQQQKEQHQLKREEDKRKRRDSLRPPHITSPEVPASILNIADVEPIDDEEYRRRQQAERRNTQHFKS